MLVKSFAAGLGYSFEEPVGNIYLRPIGWISARLILRKKKKEYLGHYCPPLPSPAGLGVGQGVGVAVASLALSKL